MVPRVHQALCQLAIIGQQQQAFRKIIKSSNRINSISPHLCCQAIQNRRTPLRIVRRTHDLDRLVQHDIGKRGGQSRKPLSLDLDDIISKDTPAGRMFHHPVDLDSPGKNKLIGLAAGTVTGGSDEFVEPDPILQVILQPGWNRLVPWSRGGMTALVRSGYRPT